MGKAVTRSAWAKSQGFSAPYATKLIQQGVIPTLPSGKVDDEEATAALEAFMNPAAPRRRADTGDPMTDATAPQPGDQLGHLLLKAKIQSEIERGQLAKLSRRKKEGELVEAVKVDDDWARVGQMIRDALLPMPQRVAAQVAAMTDPVAIRDLLAAEVRQTLTYLSGQIENEAAAA